MVVHAWYPTGVPDAHSLSAAPPHPWSRTCRRSDRRRSDHRRSKMIADAGLAIAVLAACCAQLAGGPLHRIFANSLHSCIIAAYTRTLHGAYQYSIYTHARLFALGTALSSMMHLRSVCACILPSHTCTHPASIHVCRSLLPSYYTRLVHARTPSGITRRPVKTTATRCRPSTALSAASQRPSVPPANGP